jgi:alcohol dehydrogenase (cytochrome c)
VKRSQHTWLSIALGAGVAAGAAAQFVDPKKLANPPADAWLTYHGEYNGQRHSRLVQITPENVGTLEQVWHFQTGESQPVKASPILAGGILYLTMPDHIWALDARTGKQKWHYQHPRNNAFHIGHRGAAVYNDTVYLTTPDCHLIAFQAKSGKIKWDVIIADSNKGYWSTNAPLVVGNHVLVGVSGGFRQRVRAIEVDRRRDRQDPVDFLQHPSRRLERT